MKLYDSDAPLISLHIPKTGGTSLTHALESWFPDGRLIRHYRAPDGELPPRCALDGPICVHGHFNAARGFGIPQYYPQASQFIVFLREPFDRFLSIWFYMQRTKREGRFIQDLADDPDFPTFLSRRADEQMQNLNSYSLVWHFPHPSDNSDIGGIMDRLFVFVGTTERFCESLDALAAALRKPAVQTVHHNETARDSVEYRHWRPFYEKHFSIEFEFYEAAVKRNGELIQRHRN